MSNDAISADATTRRSARLTETIDPDQLTAEERESLIDALYPVFTSVFSNSTRDFFISELLLPPHTQLRIGVFYGAGGEIAGFVACRYQEVEYREETHIVFRVVYLSRLEYNLRAQSARFLMRHLGVWTLRHLHRPQHMITLNATQAAYRLLAQSVHEVYPRRDREPTSEMASLVSALTSAGGLSRTGSSIWVVSRGVGLVAPERLAASTSLSEDPDAAYFRSLVRGHGPECALLCYSPGSLRNYILSVARHTRRQWRQRARRRGTAPLRAFSSET